MTNACMVVGNSYQSLKSSESFGAYLTARAGVDAIDWIKAGYISADECLLRLRGIFESAAGVPMLLYYNGHGGKLGWGISDGIIVGYRDIAKIILEYSGQVLVVNDCCYAHGLADALEAQNADTTGRVGVLAASRSNRYTYGSSFTDTVLADWEYGKVYRTKLVREKQICRWTPKSDGSHTEQLSRARRMNVRRDRRRWGAVLDYHFLSQSPLKNEAMVLREKLSIKSFCEDVVRV